jgi:copper chaperone CopZ
MEFVKGIGTTLLFSFLFALPGQSQFQKNIIGTIGDEKPGPDEIVICVYGSAQCMPVKIDTTQTVKFNEKDTHLNQLPFGLYIEVQLGKNTDGRSMVYNISIDEDKTVICFMNLEKGQYGTLENLLSSIRGVIAYKVKYESNQVFIEFDHKAIAYQEIENKIRSAGFELE